MTCRNTRYVVAVTDADKKKKTAAPLVAVEFIMTGILRQALPSGKDHKGNSFVINTGSGGSSGGRRVPRAHARSSIYLLCSVRKVTFLFSSSIEISAWILLIKLCSIATASSSALPPIRPTMLSAEGETGVVQGLFRKYIYH